MRHDDAIHHGFFRAGILTMFTAGGVFGGVLLAMLAWRGDLTALDLRAAIWAHAHAQVAGWVTFFVMGFAYHAFPRFKRTSLARPRLAAATLWVMAAGLAVRVAAGLADQTAWGQIAGAAGGLAELGAVAAFVWILAETWRSSTASVRPWERFVFAALGWMLLAFTADVAVFAASGPLEGEEAWIGFIALYDAPWRDVQLLGFAAGMILGVSQRLLPEAYGFREVPAPVARTVFWMWNLAVAGEIVAYMAFISTHALVYGVAWLVAVAALLACVVVLAREMRLFGPAPASDVSLRFIRAAFVWGGVSFVMLMLTPVYSRAVGQTFSHAWFGAFRHALTVGFISLMIVGVSSWVVRRGSGAGPSRLGSLAAAFWLLNIGCAMRVGFQVLTDLYGWAFPPTALSAPVELTGFALWAVDLVRQMRRRAAREAPPSPTLQAASRVAL